MSNAIIRHLACLPGLLLCTELFAQTTEIDLPSAAADTGGGIVDGAAGGDLLGWSLTGEGDFNGDGVDDLVIAAQGFDVPGGNGTINNAGAVYVVFGASGVFDSVDLSQLTAAGGGDGGAGFVLYGAVTNENVGTAVVNAGDANGDGVDDLLIGSVNMPSQLGGGGAYLIFGRTAGDPMPAEFNLSDLRTADNVNSGFGVVLEGSQSGGNAGIDLAGNVDLNADGQADFVIGSNFFGTGGVARPGAIFVVYGRPADAPWPAVFRMINLRDNVSIGDQGFLISGDVAQNGFGSRVAAVGDFTGDGIADLLVASPSASASQGDGNSAGFLIPGRVSGPGVGFDVGLDLSREEQRVSVLRLLGDEAEDQTGESVAGIGDVNGDGRPDLAVSAPRSDLNGEDSGSIYVLFGRTAAQGLSGSYDLSGLLAENGGDGSQGFVLAGAPGQRLGDRVEGTGDINGDRIDDFLVGATIDSQAAPEAGAVYVVYGQADGFPATAQMDQLTGQGQALKFLGEAAADKVGDRIAAGGDVDLDGNREILVGARLVDLTAANDGRIYAVNGEGGALTGFTGADSRAWYDPQRAGEGIMLEVGTLSAAPSLFVTWYTHMDGEQLWLAGGPVQLEAGQTVVTMDLLQTSGTGFGVDFDASEVAFDVWGSVTLERVACDRLSWRYQGPAAVGGGQRQFEPLLSDLLGLPGCTDDAAVKVAGKGAAAQTLGAGHAGAWWDPARSGEGVVLDLERRGSQPTLFFSWFTYLDGQQSWLVGSAPFDPTAGTIDPVALVEPAGAQFGAAFNPGDVVNRPWGTVELEYSACDGLALQYQGQFEDGENLAGSLSLERFTGRLFEFSCP